MKIGSFANSAIQTSLLTVPPITEKTGKMIPFTQHLSATLIILGAINLAQVMPIKVVKAEKSIALHHTNMQLKSCVIHINNGDKRLNNL